jgi:hypothetical protein
VGLVPAKVNEVKLPLLGKEQAIVKRVSVTDVGLNAKVLHRCLSTT